MLPTAPKIEVTRRAKCPLRNEHGAALIMAIIMLVILSVLGSVVLMSSDSEMKVSGNYQVAKQTFWVADRAVEYATSRDMLMSMGTAPVDLTLAPHKAFIEAAGGGVLSNTPGEESIIRDLGAGDLPAALAGAYGSDFGANYYQVSVTAKQKNEPNAPAVRIETTIVRIYKNDDESIFITTGGG